MTLLLLLAGPTVIEVAIGQATETGTADQVTVQKRATLGSVTSTELASSLDSIKIRFIAQVSEVGTADQVAAQRRVTLGSVTSTELASSLDAVKIRSIVRVNETNTANVVGQLKTYMAGFVIPSDLRNTVVVSDNSAYVVVDVQPVTIGVNDV